MKIAWIRIKGFQQFEDTFIDFRHPETGKALDKICLIGRNGTGKSTILQLLFNCFSETKTRLIGLKGLCAVKIETVNSSFILIITGIQTPMKGSSNFLYRGELELEEFWFEKLYESIQINSPRSNFININVNMQSAIAKYRDQTLDSLKITNFEINNSELLIYCPSESIQNNLVTVSDVPNTNLDNALQLFKTLPFQHIISNETIASFWRLLIFLIKKRENDRNVFEDNPDNQAKTKGQLKEEFDASNPDILKVVSGIWNEILEKAGLKFDYENAKLPIQLTENLQAYIVNNKNERVNYNKLSTGVRNFIFRFGHIKTLYFNREIKKGLLLVDEPENSLFPDFLLNIIEQYGKVTTDKNGVRNTQMFFATHSPIIASQFEPHERIILDWDEDGSVKARKGTAPEGDDPNDILYQDFGMTEIVSKKGQEVWKAYLDLKKRLTRETDEVQKKVIAEEILKIGREYNFN